MPDPLGLEPAAEAAHDAALFADLGLFPDVHTIAAFTAVTMLFDQWHTFFVAFGRVVGPESQLIQDGAKLLAQVTWMGYLLGRASDALRGKRVAA
jgi:hypothetical protein